MALDSISSATNPATSTIAKSTDETGSTKSNLGLDEATFLKLLVTQLKNQDPTNPTDPSAWTQQVASLSQVEQQTNTNTKLDKLIGLQSGTTVSAQLSSAVNYIGKTAQVEGDTFVVSSTGDVKFSYDVPAGTSNTLISISDDAGNLIGSFAGKNAEGKQNVIWDAKNASGNRVDNGNYKIVVAVVDGDSNSTAATTYIYDKVMSVGIDGGKTNVVLDQGQIVPLEDIVSVQ
jgi:flagellar basal-body rod modification protein FlgD